MLWILSSCVEGWPATLSMCRHLLMLQVGFSPSITYNHMFYPTGHTVVVMEDSVLCGSAILAAVGSGQSVCFYT